MSEPRFDTAAVVLGMHRSGTSALAGVLGLKGFATPRTVLSSSAVNERGFWESERVNALNDELFVELGTTWHGLDGICLDARSKTWLQAARARADAILAQEFDGGVRPLVKDPRLCRLLPLWQPAITDRCRRAVYVITLRNPIEVAQSLAKRNDFDLELGYLLWARYYLDAEYHTRGLPRAIITYDSLFSNWRASLDALAKVGLDLGTDSASDVAVDDYLSAELRHHRTVDEQAIVDLAHLPVVRDAYSALRDWAHRSLDSAPDPEGFDRAREQFDTLGRMLSKIVENARLDRKRLRSVSSQADSIAAELQRARRASDELSGLRAALEEQSAAQSRIEERFEAVAASLSEAIHDRAKLEQLLADSRAEAKNERTGFDRLLAKTVAEAEEEQMALTRALQETRQAGELLSIEIEQLRSDSLAAGEQHAQEVNELSSERGELLTELNDVKRKYRSTQHQLARDREKLKRAQERLAQIEASIAGIRASAVWRGYEAILATLHRCETLLRRIFDRNDRKLHAQRARLIRTSSLFDGDWYRSQYADVAAAGIDPAFHYLENGWKEGRDPSQSFSTKSYLRSNPDVARAGINPLLHFIEFGYSEGRHLSGLPAAQTKPAVALDLEFGPAAPCISFTMPDLEPVRWRRAFRLGDEHGDVLTIGDQAIALVTSGKQRGIFEAAIRRLEVLSGYAAASDNGDGHSGPEVGSHRLIDAWYINDHRIRTRWRTDKPMVIRVYQCNPVENGTVSMVGEGLAVSEVDFIDVGLSSAYFPLLFVFASPDGIAQDFELLAFPSLCRGGLHYAELLVLDRADGSSSEAIDIAGVSGALANQLALIVNETAVPFVTKILVNLNGAHGTEPVFQRDFQTWLSTVFRMSLEPLDAASSPPTRRYLSDAVRTKQQKRACGGNMVVAADMVPTISVLVMASKENEAGEKAELPLLIAGADYAQPATYVELPGAATSILGQGAPDHPPVWPSLDPAPGMGAAERIAACAIRYPKSLVPGDSELLVPVAQPQLPLSSGSPPISWLVFPEDWDDGSLAQGLHALSLQDAPALALVGEVQPAVASLAHSLFEGRVHTFADVTAAVAGIETRLIGYLGAQVILHDQRTSKILSSLLDQPAVVSASCVLVSTEKRGKGWHVSVADPGTFSRADGQEHSLMDRCQHAQLFWWSTYPALRPPRDLWVAKSASVAGWLQRAGPLRADEGVQLCTSLVTAGYVGHRREGEAHLRPPAAAVQQTLRSEALFG
jgi:hypothetical protein